MASSYTDLLRLEKQANNENDSTWGTKINTVFEMIEDAIAGRGAVTHDNTASYTLSTANSATDEARNMMLNIAGALTAARNVVVPTYSKLYIVKNATTGGYSITVKTAAGTGILVPNGKTSILMCDGTNVVNAVDFLNTLTVLDANFSIVDDSDITKVLKFQCSGITTGTTRTITVPDASDTMVTLAASQTLTNKTIAAGSNTPTGFRLQGKETVWLPAQAFTARTTNGAASGSTELATNDIMLVTYDFDASTSEGVQFMMAMPKGWDEGTVTFTPLWTAASGSGTVIWGLKAVALSDDDAMDTALGTAQTSTDTLITANDMHIGPESSAITVGGSPAEGDLIVVEVYRDISDTLAVDAKLIGVRFHYTTNASDDT